MNSRRPQSEAVRLQTMHLWPEAQPAIDHHLAQRLDGVG